VDIIADLHIWHRAIALEDEDPRRGVGFRWLLFLDGKSLRGGALEVGGHDPAQPHRLADQRRTLAGPLGLGDRRLTPGDDCRRLDRGRR
jgi:hypothetical protein